MITVYDDGESLSRAAAALFAREARSAVAARGRFGVALSGGETPRRAYEMIADESVSARIDWARVHVFWGDERCVPGDDPRSNERMAREALLARVPVPEGNIHPMRCAEDPAGAARRYEEELRAWFDGGPPNLDLVLLGLGENGHTAGLFPGDATVAERRRWVAEAGAEGEGFARVTMTPVLINAAELVLFLVSGAEKARVMNLVMKPRRSAAPLPAQLIRPCPGELLWMADRAAAAQLDRHMVWHC